MSLFPDQQVMNKIKAAFEGDGHIPPDYKKNVRVSYSGKNYLVIANNTKFLAVYDQGQWRFKNDGLYA